MRAFLSHKDERVRVVAVLERPPIVFAETAVRIKIVKAAKQGEG
jgi:hypothetical protein